MELRKLGKSDISIAPIAFGANVFGWTANKAESFNLLDAMLDQGLNMIDTADVYSAWVKGHQGGESETIIGEWLQKSGRRDEVVLATKVGMQMGNGNGGLSSKHIAQSIDDSLKRLKTDYIDVYYAHKDDSDTPIEETLSCFDKLIQEGKIRTIGSSNYTAERLDEALHIAQTSNLPQFIVHQPEYNLFDRAGYEGELETICQEHGLGVVTYFSLASGFLTGKYKTRDDLTSSNRRAAFLDKYFTERGLRILKALEEIAEGHNTTQVATALAWIIQRPSVTAPIASATSTAQLTQLVKAANLKLSETDIQKLNDASAG